MGNKDGYSRLSASIKSGNVSSLYYFHGEEKYLLENSLTQLRALLCPDGLESFNYKRFEGHTLDHNELEESVNTLPVFAERTFIEIHDYNIFKSSAKERLVSIFADLPEYVCIVFVFDTVAFKPDRRLKLDKELLKHAEAIEFVEADKARLIRWIISHFNEAGKKISTADAEYMVIVAGSLMTALKSEIDKTASFAKDETVTRADIDAVVTPVIDVVAYKLTDAIVKRDYEGAVLLLADLLTMREAAHKLMYGISLKMRQVLAARVCLDLNIGMSEFMLLCDINYDFQAKIIMNTARNMSLAECKKAVLVCSDAALLLHSSYSNHPEACMAELLVKLAMSA